MEKELINEKFKHHEEQLRDHNTRISKLEVTYSIMQNLDYRVGKVEETVKSIDKKLDLQQENKSKKWDKLIDYLFYFILASILGYIAINLGIK